MTTSRRSSRGPV